MASDLCITGTLEALRLQTTELLTPELNKSEVREQVDLLKPFLMSTIKERTTLREAP